MAGLTDFAAAQLINHAAGVIPLITASSNRFIGLFTTSPTSDSGVTGATEVSGGSYARIQIAGAITVNGTTSTASPTLHVASVPAWLAALGAANGAGVNVYDVTTGLPIGTVSTCVSAGTTITLTGNATNAVGATDSLQFSAFSPAVASVGSEPVVTAAALAQNASVITFAQTSASWGTVPSWAIFDAVTSGSNYWWDFFGNFKWSPFTCTSASPGVLTCTDQAFVNGQTAVVSEKDAGLLPTTGGSWAGLLTVAGVSGSTFNLGVNTTGTGDGLVRQVVPLSILNSLTTVSFAANQLTLAAG